MMILMLNPLVWLVSSDDDGSYVESTCLSVSFPPSLFSPPSPESEREGRRKRYRLRKRETIPLKRLVSSDDDDPYVESSETIPL